MSPDVRVLVTLKAGGENFKRTDAVLKEGEIRGQVLNCHITEKFGVRS